MRIHFSLCWFLLPLALFGQKVPDCQDMLRQAKNFEDKNELSKAVQFYLNALNCNSGLGSEIGPRLQGVFGKIEAQKEGERRATERAREEALKANIAKEKADSIATAAQRAARRAYADDLAYKSTIALRDGDRTAAFRLAEFAHRYVDDDNLNVTNALVEAIYYNENPAHQPLAWLENNLTGHTDGISCVAFSPDGKKIATGSYDQSVKIWGLDSGKELMTFIGHKTYITSLAFSLDGKRLVTGSFDNTAKIWDLDSGTEIRTLHGHISPIISLAISPDGKSLATGSIDNTAKIWDLDSGKETMKFTTHTNAVNSVAFSPNSKVFATGSSDYTAKIWDLDTGKEIMTLSSHTNGVNSVAFSPDGKRLATGASDNTAKIWDLDTGKDIMTLSNHTSPVNTVAFSPDGKQLATGSEDKTAKIWNLDNGKDIMTLRCHSNAIRSLTFSPNGKQLVTGSEDKTAKVWDLDFGKDIMTLGKHSSSILSVAFSPDGKRLATGSHDNTVKIWDLDTGKEILTLSGHSLDINSVAFSPDGKMIATGSSDYTAKIWDLDTGNDILTLNSQRIGYGVRSVAFSPDGKKLATGSEDNSAKIWDLKSGNEILTLWGHSSYVSSVAFSPDGKKLATGSYDYTAKIWDLDSGNNIMTLFGHSAYIYSVAFSPNGKKLATGAADNTAKIWNLENGKDILTLNKHAESVSSLAFSPDGKYLATGSSDQTVKVWDLENGKDILTLYGHVDGVYCVAFSPDGKKLATGSKDNTAKVWELTPQGWQTQSIRSRPLAGLIFQQLNAYNLSRLLDIRPENEGILCQSKDTRQITAFAELHAQNTRSSRDLYRTSIDYARAARLYYYALYSGGDSSLFENLGYLYHQWAVDILESARPDTACWYIDQSCRFYPDKSQCPRLWSEYSEKTNKEFHFEKFLASEKADELASYGNYFYQKGRWDEAWQLFTKAEGKHHSTIVLEHLHTMAEKKGEVFDFQRFWDSENAAELEQYASYFYEREHWPQAFQLFEKSEHFKHSPTILLYIFDLAEKLGQPFDFQRFLNSEDVEDLQQYGDFLFRRDTADWDQARQLYQKIESIKHDPEILQKLYTTTEANGEIFDFNRFLDSEDVEELDNYAIFFTQKADVFANPKDKIPYYKNALQLREKQMTFDTTTDLRVVASQEYNSLGYYNLFQLNGIAAQANIQRALELDPSNKFPPTNLPPALLLQNRFDEAKAAYLEWAAKPFGENGLPTYRDAFLSDFVAFRAQGLTIPRLNEIETLLKSLDIPPPDPKN